MTLLITSFGSWQIQTVVILIAIDVLLGIIAAIVKKEFVFSKLANFMKVPILAYTFGLVIIEEIRTAIPLPSISLIAKAAFWLVVITLAASIFRNLGKLGIPVPGDLKK